MVSAVYALWAQDVGAVRGARNVSIVTCVIDTAGRTCGRASPRVGWAYPRIVHPLASREWNARVPYSLYCTLPLTCSCLTSYGMADDTDMSPELRLLPPPTELLYALTNPTDTQCSQCDIGPCP